MISGPEILPKTSKPASIVILLHGYGADGQGFISLAQALSQFMPNTYFIAPNAIFPFENASTGYQWFGLRDYSEASMFAGLNAATPHLNQFVDHQLQRFDLPASKLALVGFSQGAMLALHIALRRPAKIAGVVGISGMLVSPQSLIGELKSKPPISLIHGTEDDVIPIAALDGATIALKSTGLEVESLIEPGVGHFVGEKGFAFATKALKRYLDA